MIHKKGFTLIELLVVVLIIGILASVAVMQYQKAVMRSRASEAFIILKRAKDAFSLAYMADPSVPPNPQDILDLPGCEWHGDGPEITNCRTQYFDYHLAGRSVSAFGFLEGNSEQASFMFYLETPYSFSSNWDSRKDCAAYTDRGFEICQAFALIR